MDFRANRGALTDTQQQPSGKRMGFKTSSGARKSGSSSVKTLSIKNFKASKPALPANYKETSWATLEKAIESIHNAQDIHISLEELYRLVESMCTHQMSTFVYGKLEVAISEHTKAVADSLGVKNDSLGNVDFLQHISQAWNGHCREMRATRSIFLFLDRTFVIQMTGVDSIWDLGLKIFLKHIAGNVTFTKKIVSGLLELIENERKGVTIERGLVKTLIRMFISLKVYKDIIQKPFLDATEEFYRNEGQCCIKNKDTHGYLHFVSNRLSEENERVLHYLESSTRKPLIKVVEKELLETYSGILLERGFGSFMGDQRFDDLKLMYELLNRVDALKDLRKYFNVYVKKKGTELVGDTEREKEMVNDLLQFKSELDNVLKVSFNLNPNFKNTLKDSFESAINSRANKPAELIAKYIDQKLRTGTKEISEENLDCLLDKVMVLFRCIQGKDVFEAFYKKDLAKRLLLGRSASIDAEVSMLSKLKQECGANFTYKLEGMFKDVENSKKILANFLQSKFYDPSFKNFSASVLTTGQWPPYPSNNVIILPELVLSFRKKFEEFYTSTNANRLLTWVPTLEQCTLKAQFGKEQQTSKEVKELSVSCNQALVLLLFNNDEELTYEQVLAKTNIDEKNLKIVLITLSCGKAKVLKKEPKGTDIPPGCKFIFRSDFKHKYKKIRINQIQAKETKQEHDDTAQKVFQDRQWQVDAAVVRIMKMRKTLSHTSLMTELIHQLKFPAKGTDLKKRIETLIDREYIKRDETNKSIYHYED